MEWLEVKISTDPLYGEAICNFIHEIGVGGVVIEDQQTVENYIKSNVWDYYSEDVHVLEDGMIIKCYLPVNDKLHDTLSAIRSYVATVNEQGEYSVTTTQLSQHDWEHQWKQFYKTVYVTPKLVIKPKWVEYTKKGDEKVVELDPGLAFGTGTHPTTNLCLKKLIELVSSDTTIIDVGCGSGILSIAAALFGGKAIALDIDPLAVKAAKENVELNNLSDRVTVLEGTLSSQNLPQCDILVANIIADVILTLIPQIEYVLKPNGYMIFSGIIISRQKEVIECLNNHKYIIKDIDIDGDWVAITAQRME
ncbi:ribosomal protein L11 methyltransferase [Anaerobranca californiensis DSM 14826]|uniref:Ribosomal protein L11 methyltransferase n=1 Tax=Anaerobranca californiensis DSM 14826 TaxID=1120989 RepID=A0A1M6N4Q0_9FIRM|nr:50S ribosomal protein L11 methyltransferase [Anaerobranca californiensis]SHJ90606.1 ribosomal protein L11 methyltransferase [Anaerobranca californiensis DSM 14826]